MAWRISNSYDVDDDGNISEDELDTALENGDLEELTNGDYYCRYSGETFWFDGTKKN